MLCKNGHEYERKQPNKGCPQCNRDRVKDWLKRNPNYYRERYWKDAPRKKAAARKWHHENREYANSKRKQWNKDNPIRVAVQVAMKGAKSRKLEQEE